MYYTSGRRVGVCYSLLCVVCRLGGLGVRPTYRRIKGEQRVVLLHRCICTSRGEQAEKIADTLLFFMAETCWSSVYQCPTRIEPGSPDPISRKEHGGIHCLAEGGRVLFCILCCVQAVGGLGSWSHVQEKKIA